MKKNRKKWAAAGFSTVLAASMALPSAAFAKEESAKIVSTSASSMIHSWKEKNEDQSNKFPVSEDSFVIKYKTPLTAAEHKAAGGTVKRQVSKLNYAEIKVKNKANLSKVMKTYSKLGKVRSISPSYLYKKLETTSDPKAGQQYQHTMLHTDQAQRLAGKNQVIVAVVDGGVDMNHPDLKNILLPGYNAANPANQPLADSHGTHVAGIVAAEKGNGIGGHGIATNVKILPVDVFDGFIATDATIAEGIMYAVDHGAKVINMSLGGYGDSPIMREAVAAAISKGVTVVAAAGNDNSDMVSTPAGYEGVISVGSLNSDRKLSSYSNYGPSVDVVAPGEDVYSSLYDPDKKSTYDKMSGTSMASPVVAGAAALLLTKNPNLTPAQVEYILEKTADDLGERGYDLKYANGVINPVKALSYNVKSIPAYVKGELSNQEVLKEAAEVDATKKIEKQGKLTKPFEQQWIKFDVKKGQYIQNVLNGSKQYDYKIMVRFFGTNGQVQSEEVNETQDGSVEAKLIQAPFDGTVAIGVKDVNGNYDDSGREASSYTLSVETADQLPADESSTDRMIDVDPLPYKTPQPFTIAGENGDYDYFKLKVKEKQSVKVDMSGIAGLNTAIELYNISALTEDQEMTAEEKQAFLKETLEGEDSYMWDMMADRKGIGQGEKLNFTAEPDQEYIIKVRGDGGGSYGGMFITFGSLFAETIGMSNDEEKKPSSLLPYTLSVESKAVTEDEDGLNESSLYGGEEDESAEQEAVPERLKKRKGLVKASAVDPYFAEQTERIDQIVGQALPFTIGEKASGYIQDNADIDFYLVEPEESSILDFTVQNKDGILPLIEINEVVEQEEANGDRYVSLNPISNNFDWASYENTLKDRFYTGLQKGKKYVIAVGNDWSTGSSVSYEPYEIQASIVASNVEDEFEPNDETTAVKLPSSSFQANVAMPNDVDSYYFTAEKTGIKAVTFQVGKADYPMQLKYPQELLSQYHPIGLLYEDTDNDHKIDYEKDVPVTILLKGPLGFTSGSFKVTKGKSYIIQTAGMMMDDTSFSLLPYTMTITDMDRKDESTGTKPVAMKKESATAFSASGYLNAGVTGGDTDWFTFNLAKDAKGTISLATGREGDGVIDIYQNGKLIKHSDSFMQDDEEVVVLNLKKGSYQVKVSDAKGVASITPYKLKVNMK
ncbi:S8 family peptidase [Bacillus testis]|uniref:S8 family peptidase n=1 Tax=Bacillus testis TaxID=1622072 RepID=UPI00067F522B|nr:S8 family peptidase [Bacillus testis]